jgi:hypothetical protein
VTAIFRIEALAAFPIMIEGEFDVPWRGEAAWVHRRLVTHWGLIHALNVAGKALRNPALSGFPGAALVFLHPIRFLLLASRS